MNCQLLSSNCRLKDTSFKQILPKQEVMQEQRADCRIPNSPEMHISLAAVLHDELLSWLYVDCPQLH